MADLGVVVPLVNHAPPPGGNLEASVRSRGAAAETGKDRDLIEAGLSEPAG
jgi:hypothetical protein